MSSKGFNPYITVADDASPLYLLTLLYTCNRPVFLTHVLGCAEEGGEGDGLEVGGRTARQGCQRSQA